MKRSGVVLVCSCVLALAVSSLSANAAPPASGEPATWITRDVEIDLQNLPKQYTCNDLWYKVHAVLLAIGASEYMAITPYDCGAHAANGGRSPTVDARFQTLRALSGADTRWAQTTAIPQTVHLGPGEPKTLDSSDCVLLSQLNGSLFTYLGMHIVSTDLKCSSPQTAHQFSIAVETLMPVAAGRPPA